MSQERVPSVVTEQDLHDDIAKDAAPAGLVRKRSMRNREFSPPPPTQPDADDPYWEKKPDQEVCDEQSDSSESSSKKSRTGEAKDGCEYDPAFDKSLPPKDSHHTLICWTNREELIFFVVPDRLITKEMRKDLQIINGYLCHDNNDKNSSDGALVDKYNALFRTGAILEEENEGDWGLGKYRCPSGNLIINSFITFVYSCGYASDCMLNPSDTTAIGMYNEPGPKGSPYDSEGKRIHPLLYEYKERFAKHLSKRTGWSLEEDEYKVESHCGFNQLTFRVEWHDPETAGLDAVDDISTLDDLITRVIDMAPEYEKDAKPITLRVQYIIPATPDETNEDGSGYFPMHELEEYWDYNPPEPTKKQDVIVADC